MAGSYKHAVSGDGQLLCNEDFVQMVENLGDAYETVQEMYGMIWLLAAHLDHFSDTITAAEAVETARQAYVEGLEHSPGIDGHLVAEEGE